MRTILGFTGLVCYTVIRWIVLLFVDRADLMIWRNGLADYRGPYWKN